jgi:predicted MFS family arabinose efflux permease
MGWGTTSLPAVLGEQFARDLGISLPSAFAGTTAMLVVMGVAGPLLSGSFVKYGARLVMSAGSMLAAPGFFLLAAAHGPLLFYVGWMVIGVAGAAMLSTASYILLNEIAGSGAKRLIGLLMLATGLSNSLFWPISAALSDLVGWRTTVAIYGFMMLLVCFPLHFFVLPAKAVTVPKASGDAAMAGVGEPDRRVFLLLMIAVTLSGLGTWGFSSSVIQLLKIQGVEADLAILVGSAVGWFQLFARVLDLFGGKRWDGLTTALVGGVMLPIGFLASLVGGAASWAVFGFIALYGLASGTMAVARATMPLVFYDQAAYVRAMSRISLPLSIGAAVAPPIFVAILTKAGPAAVLLLAIALALGHLAIVVALIRKRNEALAR